MRVPVLILLLLLIDFGSTLDYKLSVLIYSEPHESFDELKVSVTTAFVEVFGSTTYRLGNDTIQAAFVDAKRGQNRLELTQDIVCGQMLNSSLASVIFSPSLTSSSKFLDLVISSAYTLSFYKLPVVGVMVRDAEFSKKNIYPTFVRPTAPLSDEAFVFLHMLLRLQYRQVVVLSVKRDTNADQFVAEFERRRVEFKIIVQVPKKSFEEPAPRAVPPARRAVFTSNFEISCKIERRAGGTARGAGSLKPFFGT